MNEWELERLRRRTAFWGQLSGTLSNITRRSSLLSVVLFQKNFQLGRRFWNRKWKYWGVWKQFRVAFHEESSSLSTHSESEYSSLKIVQWRRYELHLISFISGCLKCRQYWISFTTFQFRSMGEWLHCFLLIIDKNVLFLAKLNAERANQMSMNIYRCLFLLGRLRYMLDLGTYSSTLTDNK